MRAKKKKTKFGHQEAYQGYQSTTTTTIMHQYCFVGHYSKIKSRSRNKIMRIKYVVFGNRLNSKKPNRKVQLEALLSAVDKTQSFTLTSLPDATEFALWISHKRFGQVIG